VNPVDTAHVLLEALPYIRRFSDKLLVIKYGGNAMEDDALKHAFAEDVALLKFVGMHPVIVHGGGPQISAALERAGIETEFRGGRRVTDAATMSIVEQVLVGTINKEIVALIATHGRKAVGLSGKDGSLMIARRREDAHELGLVGEVASVNPSVITALDGFIPVIAPTAADETGQTYNINADDVAAKIAEALGAEKLILLTDVVGIQDTAGELIHGLTAAQAEARIADGTITGGMIPKVECCLEALRTGVHQTHVIDGRVPHALLLELLTDSGIGTEVMP